MRRPVGLVAAALVLSGCGGSTPSAAPSLPAPEPSRHQVVPESTPSPLPSETPPPPASTKLVLLPHSCTAADGVQVVSRHFEGATGHGLSSWEIESRTPCTLDGTPRVALFEADGTRAVTHKAPYFMGGGTPHPVAIGPGKATMVAISTFRCDVTRNPPLLTTARFDFGRGAATDAVVTAHLAGGAPYCPKEYPEDVGVAAIGSQDERPPGPYAVNMRSSFDPGRHPTWGAADLDGDGKPDRVVLWTTRIERGRPFARMTVHLSSEDRTVRTKVQLDGRVRLQALSDLNGDGRAEILIGYPLRGPGRSYGERVSDAAVFTVVGHRVAMVGGAKPFGLSFSVGMRKRAAGVVCQGDEIVQALAARRRDGRYDVVHTTYRIRGADSAETDETAVTQALTPAELAALGRSECPGMGADGWAASD